MTTDLIQRLRSSSAEERRAFAIELAQTGTDKAVQELKRMVEARHRKGLRWYNYQDQLVGVEALGETGTIEALEFLSRVYSSINSRGHGESFCTYPMQGSGDLPSYENVGIDLFGFPWARRELGRKLAYSVELDEHRVEDYTLPIRPEEDIETELREIFGREPHSIIQRAIRGLETATGKAAQVVTGDSWSFYNSHNKEQLLDEYLQGKYESSRQSADRHSPQAVLRG